MDDLPGEFLSKDEFFGGTQDISPSSKENLRNMWDSVVQVIVPQADGTHTYGTGFLIRPTSKAGKPKTLVPTNRQVYNDASARAKIRFFYDSDSCPDIQCPVIGCTFYGPTSTDAPSDATMNVPDFAALESDFDKTLDETTKDRIRQLPPIFLEETCKHFPRLFSSVTHQNHTKGSVLVR
ncbi:hypothetical protein BC832DRAFT_202772 [Gaertneriomyces semiglobifer]|nr:hypothetical protein BC832DRAFT_202772 [Gaertneriomyces semiglobifer]